jgi:diguanylate cyclase (GGDEF)-like protein
MIFKSPQQRQLQLHWQMATVVNILLLPFCIYINIKAAWASLTVYMIVTLITWLMRRSHEQQSVMVHLVLAFLITLTGFYFSHGELKGQLLGPVSFAALAANILYSACANFGRNGVIASVIASIVSLLLLKISPLTALATIQLGFGILLGDSKYRLIQEMGLAQWELKKLATCDPLTQLENRRGLVSTFDRYLAIATRREVPLLLTSWDVNDLKTVNDTEGHAAGDAHLQAFVQALLDCARSEDAFFRIGGDEFVGLHIGLEHGAEVIERVQTKYADAAAGWSVVHAGLEATLKEADVLLYRAKAHMKASATLEELEANG